MVLVVLIVLFRLLQMHVTVLFHIVFVALAISRAIVTYCCCCCGVIFYCVLLLLLLLLFFVIVIAFMSGAVLIIVLLLPVVRVDDACNGVV